MAQCPNCGGYKTEVQDQGAGCGLTWLIFGGWILAAGGLFFMTFAGSSRSFLETIGNFLMGAIMMAAGIGPYVLAVINTKPYLLECKLCGRKWSELNKPPVQVRPDLIEKGEQHLSEEEERRARFMAEEAMRRAGMRK